MGEEPEISPTGEKSQQSQSESEAALSRVRTPVHPGDDRAGQDRSEPGERVVTTLTAFCTETINCSLRLPNYHCYSQVSSTILQY